MTDAIQEEFCLAARLGGPDRPPFLCDLPKGHDGQHIAHRAEVEIWRWGPMGTDGGQHVLT